MQLAASAFDYENIENDPAVIYVVDSALRLVYCNAAWDRFAVQNGGPELIRQNTIGDSVLDAIPEELRGFYAEGYARAKQSATPWEHDYECSSAQLYRLFHMRVMALPNSLLLVENSLRVEKAHDSEDRPIFARDKTYSDDHGIIAMCAHCRRTRRAGHAMEWHWVPDYVSDPPEQVSHGLCKNCRAFYFGF
jgi:hypothetical protein